MNIQRMLVDYLSHKETEMNISLNKFIDEKNEYRKKGYYRLINSINHKINIMSTRLHSLNYMCELINNISFQKDVSTVLDYLSPYGTFYDRYIFYYNENTLQLYNDHHQVQIILCELFNSLQDYYINEFMSHNVKLSCRGRSLSCLYHIGIIDEYVPLYNGNESQIVVKFNDRYPSHTVITFEPNDNAAKLLFNNLIFNNKKELGIILERWELHDSLTIKVKSLKLHITESDGIEMVESPNYEIKTFYFVKNGEQYSRSSLRNSTIKEGNKTINITKKLMDE